MTGAGEAIFGGKQDQGSGGGVLQGIGGAFGQSLGHHAGSLLAQKGSQLLGLSPKPAKPKSVEQNIADTNKYLDGVFPGTNPWERLGVNAGSPMEIAQENQRTQQQQAQAALRTQLAVQAGQFAMQRQLQEAQLSTQKQIKQMEIAGAKDVATTSARAAVINNMGVHDPAAVQDSHEFLTTGRVTPGLSKRVGNIEMRQMEFEQAEARLHNDIERVNIEKDRAASQRITAEAARLAASKSGTPWGAGTTLGLKVLERANEAAGGALMNFPPFRALYDRYKRKGN